MAKGVKFQWHNRALTELIEPNVVPFPCWGAAHTKFWRGAETGVSIPTQGGETAVATQKKRPPKSNYFAHLYAMRGRTAFGNSKLLPCAKERRGRRG